MRLLALLLVVCAIAKATPQDPYQAKFLTIPSPDHAYENLAYYTSLPHVAGTPEDYETAVYTRDKMRSYGLQSEIEAVDVLLTYPLSRSLKIVSPPESVFEAVMKEDYEPVDPTTADKRTVDTFNGYAPSGDATGPLVYVNYGRTSDFEYLVSQGIELKGAIAIARYGQVFRGIKAMIAQEYGMAGVIIYSDPKDDGYDQGVVFPNGPWRSNTSVQRGSVQFLSICPGDPRDASCGYDPATYNYTHTTPSIPVQPISYSDAEPFLRALGGSPIPDSSWQGGLPFTYYIGPGPAQVNLKLSINTTVAPIWNVITTIPGTGAEKDDLVLIGNHRDAWTFGAVDPNSGTAAMLEVARAWGELLKDGWQPRRTIKICSWDGEEYGLLGSTAYARNNADELTKHAIAYLNVDTAVSGSSFSASASPSLADVIRLSTTQVTDPISGAPLSTKWSGRSFVLGSGSDYTAFLDHLGIPSTSIEFDGDYGVYHSVYDDMYWMQHFGDPTFEYHVAMAQVWGLMAMKLADATILPLNFTRYGEDLEEYLASTVRLASNENMTLDATELNMAIEAFQTAAANVTEEIERVRSSGADPSELNNRLMQTERQFLSRLGLPRRPFYKHVIQAPGLYQGYAPDTFPAVKQVLRAQDQLLVDLTQRMTAIRIADAANFLCNGCVDDVASNLY